MLMNSTSIGMHPDEDATPVDAAALGGYRAVFDAVYTPLETRLLKVRAPRPRPFQACSHNISGCAHWCLHGVGIPLQPRWGDSCPCL